MHRAASQCGLGVARSRGPLLQDSLCVALTNSGGLSACVNFKPTAKNRIRSKYIYAGKVEG